MKKIIGPLILIIGIFASSNAMAIHTCGQMLGSCLAHWDPITIPKPIKPITVEPVIIKPQSAVPIYKIRPKNKIGPSNCYKDTTRGLIQIVCPK